MPISTRNKALQAQLSAEETSRDDNPPHEHEVLAEEPPLPITGEEYETVPPEIEADVDMRKDTTCTDG